MTYPSKEEINRSKRVMNDANKWLFTSMMIVVAYVVAQMLADVSSIKIGILAGVSFDLGTLIYPITFTIRDMLHKRHGKLFARKVVIAAAVVNIIMAGFFWLCSIVPYDVAVGVQPDWDAVLAPVWRIVVASIIAEVLSEIIDGEVYEKWVAFFGEKWQWTRVLVSNAVSIPLDSVVFVILAFYGTMPAEVLWSIFAANVVVKFAMTILSIFGIYIA